MSISINLFLCDLPKWSLLVLVLMFFFLKKKSYLFIYLADLVFIAACGLSLVAESGAYFLLAARRVLIAVAPRS